MARNGLIDEHDATIIGKSIGDRDNIAAGSTKPGRIQRVFAVAVLTLFLALSFYTPVLGCCRRLLIGCQEQAPASIEEQARQILAETPLIDGHVDFPLVLRAFYRNRIYSEDFRQAFENGTVSGHVDLKRLRDGRSGGAFWSVYSPCPENGTDFSDENYAASVQFTLDQIDVMARLQELYSDDFSQKVDSNNAMDAFTSGRLISPLGIEGLHQIGNRAANIRRFYELGVRYATLTHNCHNKFADAALVDSPPKISKPLWGGVSPLGQQLVREMNRIGMIIDLAHVSENTMVDVLAGKGNWTGSLAPPIFSHSSAYSICPHPRNVKDSVLHLVKERESVVLVNIAPDFIACRASSSPSELPDPVPEEATLHQVVKHIMHIGELIGYDHVGIGTDFDGIETLPSGLEDVSKYVDLVIDLLNHGISAKNVRKIVGGNVMRVWTEVDRVAAKLQADRTPALEDTLPRLYE